MTVYTLTPILGQGVNHALIDGVTLAELVDSALSPSPWMAAAQPVAAAHRSHLLQRRILGDAYFRLQPPLARTDSTVLTA